MAPEKDNKLNDLNSKAMKTKYIHIIENIFLIGLLMLFAMTTFGQSRTSRNSQNNSRNIKSTVANESNSRNSRQERTVVRERNTITSSNQDNRYTYTPRKEESKPVAGHTENYGKNNGNHSNGYHYGQDKKSNHSGKYLHNNYYYYPKTYSTWSFPAPWRYQSYAIMFRHSYGDYFFYGGNFYRYHPLRGYYLVNIPRNVIFTYLPVGYTEVFFNGMVYYRYGDVLFEYTPAGYRIITPPQGIYITAHF